LDGNGEDVALRLKYYADNSQDAIFPKLRYLDTVTTKAVYFFWEPYVPKRKLTLLEGDPGEGKSWFCSAVAAANSRGYGLPPSFGQNEIGYTLIVSAEDGIADTIKPRLEALGAEVANIAVIDGIFTLDNKGFYLLERYIQEVQPTLVIIDPLVAYLSGNLDINRANQVRYATARLARLAEDNELAMIAIRHLTKGGSSKPIYRGLGSIDFTASARSVLLAGHDPDEPETRGVVHIKSNLSPKGPPIGYKITVANGFEWLERSNLTAEQILMSTEASGSALDIAKEFLREALENGAQPTKEINKEATNEDIKLATLRRAKKALNIVSFPEAKRGKRGATKWFMKLPNGD
jgi:hypothetical protein